MIDSEKIVIEAIRNGIQEAIKNKFSQTYNNPFDKLIESVLTVYSTEFKDLLSESMHSCLKDDAFQQQIAQSVRHILAKTLVARFGGELEKQVNVLKSDPTTRARITLAIEEIVKSKS